MAKKPRLPVRPKQSQDRSRKPGLLKAELLKRLRAERVACWRVLELRLVQAAAQREDSSIEPELELDSSKQRLQQIDEEVQIAGGKSLAEEGIP